MNVDSEYYPKELSLRSQVKHYEKRAKDIEANLAKRPDEWGKFQSEFNSEVNAVFHNIMNFEKENLAFGREDRVYKLKRLFIKKFRNIFAKGDYVLWCLRKPFGYAGDFKIIEDLYLNRPTTTGFDRLFDNYTQMSAIAVAVRNRKDNFKEFIINFINSKKKQKIRIMDLASGPCRDVKEILTSGFLSSEDVIFDCYDSDERAIEYAKNSLINFSNVNFFNRNAIRLALSKDINSIIDKKYDIIYSTGLFDYFDEKISTRLVKNLRKLLVDNGVLIIASVRDKFSNPSVYFMEWAAEWNLVYRSDEEFRRIFTNSGFKEDSLQTKYEQQGILQYIIASK
ncbi:MAG: class I SAM-dependent methyltransferase [Candidatus Omnitrophica bacterium]|nr:class I SAM-dependent methyltransferase [Candidatus Omnitrophota bacterium]